ncbi:Zn-dependent hydrolase [Zophobihabitans entericus]|uniref:Zn-dependent hydrolase n=1 Tax=Zophobihabitans entericus TaxID=1635327 RepID=A0A6G9IAP1_9GAMM|nr:Zn-dependent hydrolase [Zophobihabitans entericus]QIQ21291.1 Zn-dependent hydrolase [Zophobihabitans entericus]
MQASTKRIQEHIETIATFTATPGQGTTRMSYSEQDVQVRHYIKQQMAQAGLTVYEDAMGNIFGRLNGKNPDLPVVLIGSHFDSVPNGGAFDGPAGVVMGLEIATLFKEYNLVPEYPLEVVALVEEEGASFGGGLLASRAIAGQVSTADLKSMRDSQGVSAAERMAALGFDANKIAEAVRKPEQLKAFIELHIEQGPILEQSGEDIGIVETIVGLSQMIVTVEGKAGHAGTTPMNMRADALLASSQLVQQVAGFAVAEGETVATVGKLQVFPNGANVIPSKVIFSIDVRSKDQQKLDRVIDQIKQAIAQAQTQFIKTQIEQPIYVKPINLDKEICQLLTENSDKLNLKSRVMVSGAGHDAMVFAGFTRVGLIFVPSRNGLSHHPDEWTDYDQIQKGVEVIFETVKALTKAKAE